MDKNQFLRAMKLYLIAAANPFIIIFALLLMAMLIVAFFVDPEPVGSEDYMSMLGALQMGKIGVFLVAMVGGLKLIQNKFYASCCCSKMLYTAAPIVTSLALLLIPDTVLAIAAKANLGGAGLSDMLLMDSIGSALLILAASCYGKKGLSWGYAIPYILFVAIPVIVGKSGALDRIFGLSVGVSAVIAVSVYAVSVAVSLVIVNAWWKKSDRFTMPNKYLMNVMGNRAS